MIPTLTTRTSSNTIKEVANNKEEEENFREENYDRGMLGAVRFFF